MILPYVAHWSDNLFTPAKQCELIESGVPLIANIDLHPDKDVDYYQEKGYQELLQLCKALQIPITLVSTQWEQCLLQRGEKLSPFIPDKQFKEPANKFIDTQEMKWLQSMYPNPNKVLFLLNNETPKIRWDQINNDADYIVRYPVGLSYEQRKEILRDAWMSRFNIMFAQARSLLTPEWSRVSRFIGYEAFARPEVGRWHGWGTYSNDTHEMIDWQLGCFDGCSAVCYTHNWNTSRDHWIWSPQIECMNYLWQQRFMPPDYYFELSVWDGNYHWYPDMGYDEIWLSESKACQYMKDGQTYTPERYEGFIQFCMWLMRCNIREWRQWNVEPNRWALWTQKLIDVPSRVWRSSILRKFWEEGVLIPNSKRAHPYNKNMPSEWLKQQRFYLLETSLMPATFTHLSENIPVFAIGWFSRGGDFLVYAHAPICEVETTIEVPGYGEIKVAVPVKGGFWHIQGQSVQKVDV